MQAELPTLFVKLWKFGSPICGLADSFQMLFIFESRFAGGADGKRAQIIVQGQRVWMLEVVRKHLGLRNAVRANDSNIFAVNQPTRQFG